MIEARALPGYGRLVASITGCARHDVRCRLGQGIEGQVAAAVAGRTLATGTGVIHQGAGKRNRVSVTSIALDRCRDMAKRLAQGIATVVATGTTPGHRRCGDVIEALRIPVRCSSVACVALGRCEQMINALGLSVRRYESAIVTSIALPRRTGVIHGCGRKISGALVATITISGHGQEIGRNMACGFAQRTRVSIQATTMTGRTGQRRHPVVVHPYR